jgi:Zn-dependent peptidase ImmA (M78 family)
MFNKTRINIENKLMIDSLTDYVDELISQYIEDNKYPSIDKLLHLRLIKEIIINPDITNEAYIKKVNNYFVITTRQQLNKDKSLDRFILAHEIAHTFLYKIKSEKIFDNFVSFKSSLEQEYFCNFFARALLIPSEEIKKDIVKVQNVNSLKLFNQFSLKYNIPYSEILKRILNDLELIKDLVIIRFAKFTDETNWKIYETFMSESIRYDKKYYIPSKNYKTDVKYFDRFPTCFDKLSDYLNSLYCQMNFKEERELIDFDLDIFQGKPLKHFSNNLSNDFSYLVSKSCIKNFNTKIINVMINLKEKKIK